MVPNEVQTGRRGYQKFLGTCIFCILLQERWSFESNRSLYYFYAPPKPEDSLSSYNRIVTSHTLQETHELQCAPDHADNQAKHP
jgi:hypothetical protein